MERDCVRHGGDSFEDCREGVRDLLDSAMRMMVVSDVPLGTLLSGGLDSSLVSVMATKHIGGRLRTFSMGYDRSRTLRSDDTDAHYAGLVAAAYDTDHTELVFQPAFHQALRWTWWAEGPTTFRFKLPIARGGHRLRVAFLAGDGPATLFRATVARAGTGGVLDAAPAQLSFGGERERALAAHERAVSDPIRARSLHHVRCRSCHRRR